MSGSMLPDLVGEELAIYLKGGRCEIGRLLKVGDEEILIRRWIDARCVLIPRSVLLEIKLAPSWHPQGLAAAGAA